MRSGAPGAICDREFEVLLLSDRLEAALDELAQIGECDLARLDRHLARLDLGQVENLVDEGQADRRPTRRWSWRTRPACS